MKKLISTILISLLLVLIISVPGFAKFKGQELNLYVAAGMKKPMDKTIESFQELTGSVVLVNYGPSGGLFAQIEQDQPCDLYYSADWIYIEKIEEIGKLERSLRFLNDNLVLVVSPGGAKRVKSMQDLINPGVSLVVADAQAPVGVYSDKALISMGLMDKLGNNIKARPSTVNQVAIMVKEDQVDAGLIYSSVANGNDLPLIDIIDEEHTGEIIFGAAVIKGGNIELANAFMDFAVEHVENFEKYGWVRYE
ncbi:MAG: molybdate ABC transporter substrate-binding protein [Firmicutes bacterium]|nr:molybdate ABC transporter substrate-binding protein [Bacillota bacterium]